MEDVAGARAASLREAAEESDTVFDVESNLRRSAEAVAGSELGEELDRLRVAFGYHARPGKEPYWGPLMVLADGSQYPPGLDQIDAQHRATWTDALASQPPALAAARLADLLWTLREGESPYLYARGAADAYLELASMPARGVERLSRVYDAARAYELSMVVRDHRRGLEAATLLLQLSRFELSEAEPGPGVVLRAVSVLVPRCPTALTAERDAVLEGSVEAFYRDPFNYQAACQLRTAILPVNERALVHREVVRRWEEAAGAETGLMRLLHLQRALEEARLRGLSDLIDPLRVKIQQIPQDDLGMQLVRHSVDIADVEQMVALLVHDNWPDTLRAIGGFGPPSGTRESNRKAVAENRAAAPFVAGISQARLGFGNALVWNTENDSDERDRLDMAEVESFRINYCARYIMAALAKALQDLGAPTADDLKEIFEAPLVPDRPAERLARSLTLYLDGEFELAGLLALPSIEATIRNLNVQAGRPVTAELTGAAPGGVRTLGTLSWRSTRA